MLLLLPPDVLSVYTPLLSRQELVKAYHFLPCHSLSRLDTRSSSWRSSRQRSSALLLLLVSEGDKYNICHPKVLNNLSFVLCYGSLFTERATDPAGKFKDTGTN